MHGLQAACRVSVTPAAKGSTKKAARGTGEKGPIPIDVETEYEPQLWEPGRARRERGRLLARGERRDIQVLKSGPDDEDSVAKRV